MALGKSIAVGIRQNIHEMQWVNLSTKMHTCIVVWRPVSIGALNFVYACSPCIVKGNNFLFNVMYFGMQLSRFWPLCIYDEHGQKIHWSRTGL